MLQSRAVLLRMSCDLCAWTVVAGGVYETCVLIEASRGLDSDYEAVDDADGVSRYCLPHHLVVLKCINIYRDNLTRSFLSCTDLLTIHDQTPHQTAVVPVAEWVKARLSDTRD